MARRCNRTESSADAPVVAGVRQISPELHLAKAVPVPREPVELSQFIVCVLALQLQHYFGKVGTRTRKREAPCDIGGNMRLHQQVENGVHEPVPQPREKGTPPVRVPDAYDQSFPVLLPACGVQHEIKVFRQKHGARRHNGDQRTPRARVTVLPVLRRKIGGKAYVPDMGKSGADSRTAPPMPGMVQKDHAFVRRLGRRHIGIRRAVMCHRRPVCIPGRRSAASGQQKPSSVGR